MSKPILKQFGDFASSDFVRHPVWIQCQTADYGESWYDDIDEETFRPWTGPLPVGPEEGMLLTRAALTLADGRAFHGFITPEHEGEHPDLGIIQPQLFLPSGRRCGFWDGMFERPEHERQALYRELASDPHSIFPIRFAADEGLVTGIVSGVIPGFCCRADDQVKVYF